MSASPSESVTTLARLLALRARERPKQVAFTFHADDGSEEEWTYEHLDARAQRAANRITRYASRGDRAVLVYPPGLDFVAGFFGCLYAGVVPAPATYPRPRRPSARLDAIVADSAPSVALTSTSALELMRLDQQTAQVRSLPWVPTDGATVAGEPESKCNGAIGAGNATHDDESPFDPVAASDDELTLLQYTSGSTAEPRGVMVSHANMMANLEMIRQGFAIPHAAVGVPFPVGVFWLPAYHDMGLIGGLLTPLYVGGTSHLLAPAAFLRRPLDWLQLISRTGASISGGPNFGYQHCLRKISSDANDQIDLSGWHLAFCGAEPIDATVLQKFAEKFADAGFRSDAFYPCYGLAEATLMATGGDGPRRIRVFRVDRQQLAQQRLALVADGAADDHLGRQRVAQLVGCGRPLGSQEIVLVDPQTGAEVEKGEVGEIWLKGPAVAKGYYNAPQLTLETFQARLADGRGPYLRTGDLGCVSEGELLVTGRLKDVIIVRGRNLYPQDVERTAEQSHEAIDVGAAFGVDVGSTEGLVVVHQLHRESRRVDPSEACRAVRAAIVDEHEIDPAAIVLLRPGALPLTSSGKVQRSVCRMQYLAGELSEEFRWVNPTSDALNDQQVDPSGAELDSDQAAAVPFVKGEGKTLEELSQDVERWMLAWLAERLAVSSEMLSVDAPFAEAGIDSLTAIELIQGVETTLGVQVSPAVAWDFPTPRALSRYLAEQVQTTTIGTE